MLEPATCEDFNFEALQAHGPRKGALRRMMSLAGSQFSKHHASNDLLEGVFGRVLELRFRN
jgi:hypothetical protein